MKPIYIFVPYLQKVLALAMLVFIALPNISYSVNYTISCEDINSAESCSISGEGSFNENLADIVQELVEVLDSGVDPNDVCFAGESINEYTCNINESDPPLQLDCLEDTDTITCNISGVPEAFFAMDCSAEGEGGQCTISSDDQAAVQAVEDLGIPPTFISYAVNLLSGCASLGGTDAFRNDCDALLGAISAGDNDSVNATLAQVIPTNSDNALDGTFHTVGVQLSHVRNRLNRLRQGTAGRSDVSALQFYDGQQWLRAGELIAANDISSPAQTMNDASPLNVSQNFSRTGFFIDGSLVITEQDATNKENSADVDSQLITFGIDSRFRDNLIGGLAFSFSATEADYGNDRGKLEDFGFLLLAYGSYYRGNWYVDGSIGLGGNDYDQTRRLICDASCVQEFDQTAESDFSGNHTTLMLTSGYNWTHNAWTVSPYVQLASVSVDIDSYRETMSDATGPGAGYALDIDDQDKDSLTVSIGSQLSYAMSQDWGVFMPHFDLQFYNELDDDDVFVQGRFVGNVGVDDNFKLVSNPVDTSYYIVGVGGLLQLKNGDTTFIDVKSMQGNDNVDQLQVTAGWRWEL